MKRMYCIDVDNTLLNHKTGEIAAKDLEAISRLKERGDILVVASGRDMTASMSQALTQQIKPDAIVHMNGLMVTAGSEILHEHFFEKELLKEVVAYARKEKILLAAYIGEAQYFTDTALFDKYIGENKFLYKVNKKDMDECPGITPHALVYMGEEEGLQKLQKKFPRIKYYMFAGNRGADVLDCGASKASGIEYLLDYYHMYWQDVVAIGDSMNDVEMIKLAGTGIAMGNAILPVKYAADQVTKSVEECGVAWAIQNMVQNRK